MKTFIKTCFVYFNANIKKAVILLLFIHLYTHPGYADFDLDQEERFNFIIQQTSDGNTVTVDNTFTVNPEWSFRFLGDMDISLMMSFVDVIDITDIYNIYYEKHSFTFSPGLDLLFLKETLITRTLFFQSAVKAGVKIILANLNEKPKYIIISSSISTLFLELEYDWLDLYLSLQFKLTPPEPDTSSFPVIFTKLKMKSIFFINSIIAFRKETPLWIFGYGISDSFISLKYTDPDFVIDSWVDALIYFEYPVASGCPGLSVCAENRLFSYKSGVEENLSGYELTLKGNLYFYPKWTYLGKQDKSIEVGSRGEITLGPDTSWEIKSWKVKIYTVINF